MPATLPSDTERSVGLLEETLDLLARRRRGLAASTARTSGCSNPQQEQAWRVQRGDRCGRRGALQLHGICLPRQLFARATDRSRLARGAA